MVGTIEDFELCSLWNQLTEFSSETGGDEQIKLFSTKSANELDQSFVKKITSDLAESMPDYGIDEYYQKQADIFANYTDLAVALDTETDKVVGILGGKTMEVDGELVFYIWTAQIAQEQQGGGIIIQLAQSLFLNMIMGNWSHFDRHRKIIIALKTRNPNVYMLVYKFICERMAEKIFPDFSQTAQDLLLKNYARRVSSFLCPDLEFNPENGVIYGAQGVLGEFFPNGAPKSKDSKINRFFDQHMTIEDQVMVVSVLDFRGSDPMTYYTEFFSK